MHAKVRFPLIPTSLAAKTLRSSNLWPGDVVLLRVVRTPNSGNPTVTIVGTDLKIPSSIPLPVGKTLRARVVDVAGKVELQLLAPSLGRAAEVSTAIQSPPPPVPPGNLDLLLQALKRGGFPLTETVLSAVQSLVPPFRRRDAEFLRFASMVYDKQLKANADVVEELYLAVRPSRSAGEEEGRQSTGNRGEHVPRRVEGEKKEPDSSFEDADTGDIRPLLRSALEARGSSEAGTAALLNHLPGARASWITVPFRTGSGRLRLEGTIRLLIDPRYFRAGALSLESSVAGRLPIVRASISIDGDEVEANEREIGVTIEGNPPKQVRFHCRDAATRKGIARSLPLLAEKLRNLGVEIDDTINGEGHFDGFTAEIPSTANLDTSV